MAKRQYIQLDHLSEMFRVHPRTILRALSDEHNTYWVDDKNFNEQRILIEDIAIAYGTTGNVIRSIMEARDNLLTPNEAARVIGIQPRTFRMHVHNGKFKKIGKGGIARYLHSRLIRAAIARME